MKAYEILTFAMTSDNYQEIFMLYLLSRERSCDNTPPTGQTTAVAADFQMKCILFCSFTKYFFAAVIPAECANYSQFCQANIS